MANVMKIVLVDDDEVNLTFLTQVLQDYETFPFRDPKKALKFCADNSFDLVITDMRMPGITGLGLIKELRKTTTDFVSLVLSAYSDAEYLMESVNANLLFAYLLKPAESQVLVQTVAEALKHLQYQREKNAEEQRLVETAQRLREENTQLRFYANSPLEGLIGTNPLIIKIKEQIKAFAISDHPILIMGEEGTGKKTVARILHELSPRRQKPYVGVSCTTIPPELLELELFGAVKNPSLGQRQPKDGFLDAAREGTLVIEDVQELSKPLQAKVLKFLQYGTYYPVGGTEERSADVRVLFTSRTTLLPEMEKGDFRKELYYKIANLQIKMPPLRERREDILAIFEALAQRKSTPVPELGRKERELLSKYAYPGNIQELAGLLEKINLLARSSGGVTVEDIEQVLKENAQMYALVQGDKAVVRTIQLPTGQEPLDLRLFIDDIEREIILSTLRYADYNISQTSRNLQISRQGLKNKIKRLEIPVDFAEDEEADE